VTGPAEQDAQICAGSALRDTLKTARAEIVLAIAFLGRDAGTDRIDHTITSLIDRLAKTDAAILAVLSSAEWEPIVWRYRVKGHKRWTYDETLKNADDPRVVDPTCFDIEPLYAAHNIARGRAA
jgi:hypothetical protein